MEHFVLLTNKGEVFARGTKEKCEKALADQFKHTEQMIDLYTEVIKHPELNGVKIKTIFSGKVPVEELKESLKRRKSYLKSLRKWVVVER